MDQDFQDTRPALWLTSTTLNYDAALSDSSWIIVNKQQTGK